ncbi:hypothetical protein [Sphingosinicella xenopeptidilytica]|uniref:Uncharacterized protein n=1 Tax=Sphingosinicella xenopeptidilytica TaxID=364098 RepID=A0ABW3C570_SPHXN
MSDLMEKKPKFERVPSKIQFPYTDMSDAIAVADGMLKGGGVALSRDQLAAAMGLAPGGGGFATKISTARIFGVLDAVGGKYQLTELGHEIIDAARQQDARVRAFLNVELYKRAYDEFRGKLLPPRPHGLEAAFINFGVTSKNVKAARLAFEKSARMAGFYPGGNEDRLVMPFGQAGPPPPAPDGQNPAQAPSADPVENPPPPPAQPVPALHRSILGMLEELPAPKTEWSKEDQADWLQALATMFQVIYKSDSKGSIRIEYSE